MYSQYQNFDDLLTKQYQARRANLFDHVEQRKNTSTSFVYDSNSLYQEIYWFVCHQRLIEALAEEANRNCSPYSYAHFRRREPKRVKSDSALTSHDTSPATAPEPRQRSQSDATYKRFKQQQQRKPKIYYKQDELFDFHKQTILLYCLFLVARINCYFSDGQLPIESLRPSTPSPAL